MGEKGSGYLKEDELGDLLEADAPKERPMHMRGAHRPTSVRTLTGPINYTPDSRRAPEAKHPPRQKAAEVKSVALHLAARCSDDTKEDTESWEL